MHMRITAIVLTMLQAAPLPVQGTGSDQEIEVLGTRLKKLNVDLAMSGTRLTGCRISASSGDRFIDNQACKAAYACVLNGVTGARELLVCMDDRILAAVDADKIKGR